MVRARAAAHVRHGRIDRSTPSSRDIAASGDVTLGFRTAFPDNYLRPVARAASAAQADALLDRVCDAIRARLGPLVYGEGEETMEQVVGRLLRERGLTRRRGGIVHGGPVAREAHRRAGLLARTSWAASSPTADAAKRALLGVPEALLAEHGAVSDPVARAMAEGARARFGADLAIATTGISGPGRRHEAKPVGLVHLALADARARTATTSSSRSTARATASSPRRSRSTGCGAACSAWRSRGRSLHASGQPRREMRANVRAFLALELGDAARRARRGDRGGAARARAATRCAGCARSRCT